MAGKSKNPNCRAAMGDAPASCAAPAVESDGDGNHMRRLERVYEPDNADVSAFEDADKAAPNGQKDRFFQTVVFQPCTERE